MFGSSDGNHAPAALLERASAQLGNAPFVDDGIDLRTWVVTVST
jgi:hypothetical protein